MIFKQLVTLHLRLASCFYLFIWLLNVSTNLVIFSIKSKRIALLAHIIYNHYAIGKGELECRLYDSNLMCRVQLPVV